MDCIISTIFSSVWTFFGTVIFIVIFFEGIEAVVKAIRGTSE